jgi:hypothetical protein
MDSAELTDEEIENAWYSLGLRGVASANEWQTRYRFARELEKLIKAQAHQALIRVPPSCNES